MTGNREICSQGVACSLLMGLVLGSCEGEPGEPPASVRSSDVCAAPPTVDFPDSATVVVRGTDAPCKLEFRTVESLEGGAGDPLPRFPVVALGSAGGWLSATYDPGIIALWSPSGDLQRVIGKGPGEGPGEFDAVRDLAVFRTFDVDWGRGLVYTSLDGVEDPDAPSGSMRPGLPPEEGSGPPPSTPKEGRELSRSDFVDGVMEVFTLDGRLLASRRYDDPSEMPIPLSGANPDHHWYVLDDLARSITIVRPRLEAGDGAE